jgi:hypothetical protein
MKQVKLVQHPSDELDLVALFRNALLFFSYYGKLLLIVAFIGLLAGAVRFWCTPKLYVSSMIVQPTLLSDPEQIAVIGNWSTLLKKRERPLLAQQLHMDVNLLKKVQSIETEELQKSYAPKNFTAFTLSVVVTDTAVLQPLQKGIVYALDNSEYIKDRLAARKNILQSMIVTVQQEISRLNRMQNTVETNLQQHNTNGGGFIVNISGMSSQIADLQEKRLNYEEEIALISAVNVLQNFYIPANPTYPILLKQLLMGLAGGLLLGNAIAFYLYIKKRLANS